MNVAKKVAGESLEFLKSARAQVIPETQNNLQSNNETSNTGASESEIALKNKIDADSKRLLDKLEEELKQLRIKRQQQIESYSAEASKDKAIQPPEVVVPQGKMRKAFGGMKARLKQVAGKREMQKNVSG